MNTRYISLKAIPLCATVLALSIVATSPCLAAMKADGESKCFTDNTGGGAAGGKSVECGQGGNPSSGKNDQDSNKNNGNNNGGSAKKSGKK